MSDIWISESGYLKMLIVKMQTKRPPCGTLNSEMKCSGVHFCLYFTGITIWCMQESVAEFAPLPPGWMCNLGKQCEQV